MVVRVVLEFVRLYLLLVVASFLYGLWVHNPLFSLLFLLIHNFL